MPDDGRNAQRPSDVMRDRRRRTVARAAMPSIVRGAAETLAQGRVEAGSAEYLVREMQQAVMEAEGAVGDR